MESATTPNLDTPTPNTPAPGTAGPQEAGRRSLLGSAGLTGVGVAATAATALLATTPARAQALTDTDILNFALNFEYLGAEFYLRAVTGQGLAAADTTGTGTQGTVTAAGALVPFKSAAIAAYAQRLAVDEQAHVRFIRASLGSAAISEPSINLSTSWTTFAIAAGLIAPGQTFNPFADDVSFLLGAYVLEDVCVTALAGAARLLSDPNNVEAAAGLLGVEGAQAGSIRTLLANLGAGYACNLISAARATLSGKPDDQGILVPGNSYNFVPTDSNALVFRRTPAQILNIAYGGGAPANYGFFPSRVNGAIR